MQSMQTIQSGYSPDIMMKTMAIRVEIIFVYPSFRLVHLELDLLYESKKNVYI